jgi:type IV secretory pathway VirB10-like protein
MKSAHLFLIVIFLGMQPLLSDAQVYKWKDKDGSIRYTDTPPPSNIKQETIGSKKTVTPAVNPTPVGESAPTESVKSEAPSKDTTSTIKAEDAAAQIRQKNAEAEKRANQEKEAEAKRKAENCKAARVNYETYNQGGRVFKLNAKGEREFMGDNDLTAAKAQAQREINMNCL